MPKKEKVYPIRRVGGTPPESLSKLTDTLAVSRQTHRTQQRSNLSTKMAFMSVVLETVGDICDLWDLNPDDIVDRPNALVAEIFHRLNEHYLNTFVSVHARGRDDIVKIASAREMAEHEERVGVFGRIARKIKGEGKE